MARVCSGASAWQHEPLVVHVYGRLQNVPSIHLRLVPVFFNPLRQSDFDSGKGYKDGKNDKKENNISPPSTITKAAESRWRDDLVDHYLQPSKKKRVVSAYMDNHKISSLLRTFEVMSRHQQERGTPVAISWRGSRSQSGPGGYVGIVSSRGDVEMNQKFPIGMVKIVVDQLHNVVMLRSSTLDCYLTGHTDTAVVDGRADSSDVTACHWRVIPCERVFQDLSQRERNGVIVQFWSKKRSRDQLQNGLFFIIQKSKEFRLGSFSSVRDCGVYQLN